MPFVAFYHTHKLVVTLFILIYLIKTILLLMGNREALDKFNRKIKIPEMIVSALFFITGLIMLNKIADFTTLFAIKLSLVVIVIPVAVIAFKNYNKMLAILTLVLLISIYGLAEIYKAQFAKKHEPVAVVTDPANANYNITEHGKALFNAQCTICHGSDGKANLSGAKDLTLSTLSDDEIIKTIKTGKNAMPKMANIYNEQELKALVEYLKSLR